MPFADLAKKPEHVEAAGRLDEELQAGRAVRRERHAAAANWRSSRRQGERRMGANPHANGGLLLRDLRMPDFRNYAIEVTKPGTVAGGSDARRRRAFCATS